MTGEIINETGEPADAEAAVHYWRQRWAATAAALTDATGLLADVAEHATPLGEDGEGFVSTGYLVSVGAIHRALGWLRGRVS